MTLRASAILRDLRFDAGSPALDLVATLGRRGCDPALQVERLAEPGDVGRWCAGVGVSLAEDVDPVTARAALRTLREQVHQVVQGARSGVAVSPTIVSELNQIAAEPIPSARLITAEHGVSVQPPQLQVPQLLSWVTRDAMELVSDASRLARVRECESPDCRMLFELAPGARERHWCSMARCGNRAKAARHRARS